MLIHALCTLSWPHLVLSRRQPCLKPSRACACRASILPSTTHYSPPFSHPHRPKNLPRTLHHLTIPTRSRPMRIRNSHNSPRSLRSTSRPTPTRSPTRPWPRSLPRRLPPWSRSRRYRSQTASSCRRADSRPSRPIRRGSSTSTFPHVRSWPQISECLRVHLTRLKCRSSRST
ncbi:hypothetical protein BCR44DRAFT_1448079 [Catenaria anguillulae PL171]|uniref:Uncharacterized protein n=1 Tax=Catenaria anguillulae PL171 TaxID=765915 RepID=A0A1Y2H9I1_9FUNG|nr:hypothetical protein BCR44DRAFT_1448079 [Catenaria anguillulae PL171]